jgi:hypothetical protein
MSSISSATSTLNTQALTAPRGRHHGGELLDTAAKALGLSKDDLVSQLKSGKSLDDVAAAQGVSHDDLAAALKAKMPPELAASDQANDLIDAITSKKGMPTRAARGLQGPPPGTAPPGTQPTDNSSGVLGSTLTEAQQTTLDKLSSLLGTDSAGLLDSLRSGSSNLSDLISAKGVNQDSLASILQDGLLFDAKV